MAAPVFTDGVTGLNATVFNLLGNEVNKKIDLPGGAVTNGQWLKGVGGAVVWAPIGVGDLPTGIPPANIGGGYAPNKVTVTNIAAGPPASPATNDIWIATDIDATGVCWMFRYNAAQATYKWEFVGGAPYSAVNDAGVSNASNTTYSVVGPSLNMPRAGDYDIRFDATLNSAAGGTAIYVTPKRGTAAASDGDAVLHYNPGSTGATIISLSRTRRFTGMTLSENIALYVRVSSGQGSFSNLALFITPVRIS